MVVRDFIQYFTFAWYMRGFATSYKYLLSFIVAIFQVLCQKVQGSRLAIKGHMEEHFYMHRVTPNCSYITTIYGEGLKLHNMLSVDRYCNDKYIVIIAFISLVIVFAFSDAKIIWSHS